MTDLDTRAAEAAVAYVDTMRKHGLSDDQVLTLVVGALRCSPPKADDDAIARCLWANFAELPIGEKGRTDAMVAVQMARIKLRGG